MAYCPERCRTLGFEPRRDRGYLSGVTKPTQLLRPESRQR
jgi:hypothetical protein